MDVQWRNSIFLPLILILIAFYIGSYIRSSGRKSLGDILPNSFSVEFSLKKPGFQGHFVKIEWDLNANSFRYRETDIEQDFLFRYIMSDGNFFHTFSTLKEDRFMNITAVNKEAVLNIFDGQSNEWTWSCIPSLETLLFYQVVQFIPDATIDYKENMTECEGNVWSYFMHCDECMPLYFCEKDSRLISIRQNSMTAVVTQWAIPSTDTIQLPEGYAPSNCEDIRRQQEIESEKRPAMEIESEETDSSLETDREDKFEPGPYKKICLFIHGAGELGTKNKLYHVLKDFPEYWGDVNSYVSMCTNTKFIHFDTVNHGWDDPELLESFCSFATSDGDEKMITNKIIYSHSMGNLIIAAALHSGVCSFHNSTEWYSLQGPWRGSRVADWLEGACKYPWQSKTGLLPPKLLLQFLKFSRYCTLAGTPSQAYKTLKTSYKSADGTTFTDLIAVGKKYVNGILCGDSSWGMGKKWFYSSALFAIQAYSRLPNSNDGLVNYEFGCAMDSIRRFKTNYRSRFYRSKANHAEGTCRYGDIGNFHPFWWKKEKLYPCRWFRIDSKQQEPSY